MTTSANVFPLKLDHLFITVQKDAPETQALIQVGLRHSGSFNQHVGLGTKGTYFEFENAYLELLWIDDETEFAPIAALLGIPPFGIAFRHQEGNTTSLPFEAYAFHWDWMPPDSFLHIAKRDPASHEPLFFVVPDSMVFREDTTQAPSEMTIHPLGIKRLTELRVLVTSPDLSATARLLSTNTNVRVESGSESRLELTFDGGIQGKIIDVRPALPLVIRC